MRFLCAILYVVFVAETATATIVPFTLEGYPNCKCFCSKLPSLRELLCQKLCGPCSLPNFHCHAEVRRLVALLHRLARTVELPFLAHLRFRQPQRVDHVEIKYVGGNKI
ncbi:hypothetical protein Trydic_g15852 [Trypoxylus dichotomus]